VGDAPVTDGDEVVDGLVEPLVVGGADDVDGAVADGAGHHDHGQAGGEVGQVGRGSLRAEEDERLAAVLQQATHGARLIAGWGDGAERQLIADPAGRLVEVAVETPARVATSAGVGRRSRPGRLGWSARVTPMCSILVRTF
jgi:hypothetical protein